LFFFFFNKTKIILIEDIFTQSYKEDKDNPENTTLRNAIIISLSSTDKNAEIVRLDVKTGVRTPVFSLCVCEFMMTLSSLLSKKNTTLKQHNFNIYFLFPQKKYLFSFVSFAFLCRPCFGSWDSSEVGKFN